MSRPPERGSDEVSTPSSEDEVRRAAWETALAANDLPDFVQTRLADAGAGRTPWLATMTPAELLLVRRRGMRPLATVSGSCCYQYGWSWTDGQSSGWSTALQRLRREAVACGASAVVDVKMRSSPSPAPDTTDFTLIGTAVRMSRLEPSPTPPIATVGALEFARLCERGIVPVGLAVGARYERFFDPGPPVTPARGPNLGPNRAMTRVSEFWERLRRAAHNDLKTRTMGQGDGVLAQIQWSQLDRGETTSHYIGRHIVIGTVIRFRRGEIFPDSIRTVVDMRDETSPLVHVPDAALSLYEARGGKGANE